MNYYSFPIPLINPELLKYFKQQEQLHLNILNLQQQINKQKIIFNSFNQQKQNNFSQQKLLFPLIQQQQKLNNEKIVQQLTQQQLLLLANLNTTYLPVLNFPSTSVERITPTFISPNISPIKSTISYNNLFTIDKLLLKNKIKKEEYLPKILKLETNNKVDYFTEEKQLSLIDGRRIGGGGGGGNKKLNEKKKKIKNENIKYSLPSIKSTPPPSLPSPLHKTTTTINSSHSKHVCLECGKGYATSSNLSRHKQTHRPMDSPYAKKVKINFILILILIKCPVCNKCYVSMPAYTMHLLTHEAKHKCPICSKLFSRPWLLKGHLRSHTGQKPFGCGKCGKAFSDRSNLRAHLNIHNVEKRWKCKYCERSFLLKNYLNKHIEQQHNNNNNNEVISSITLPSLCENEEK